jgi:glycerate 2-kinase
VLHYQDYRQHVEDLMRAALSGADPEKAVEENLRKDGRMLYAGDLKYDLDQGRVYVLSVGKAAVAMVQPVIEILGDDLHSALVICKKGSGTGDELSGQDFHNVTVMEGNHPVSGLDSINATKAAGHMLAQAGAHDLVLCLISGGTSALLTQPVILLADWQQLTNALLASGCTISEFNLVRRRLDKIKGGGLAQMAAPATCISLILSDVIGNPLPDIGSGPTTFVAESAADALSVLERYQIAEELRSDVWQNVWQSLQRMGDNPKPVHWRGGNIIVSDVRRAAVKALTKAMQLGFVAQLLTAHLEGEAREVGRVAAAIAKDMLPGRCLILGGETTVTVRGDGVGGRNLELALAAAGSIDGLPATVIASFATDGEDGPTGAAGAVVSGETAENGRLLGLDIVDFLDRNDSFHFFLALEEVVPEPEVLGEGEKTKRGPLLKTGSTGTNVNDLLFILTYSQKSQEEPS